MNNGSVFAQDKIFLHGDRIRDYLDRGHTDAPVTLELDLTNQCNNKCPACTGYNSDRTTMDTDFAKIIIKDAAKLGVRGLIFSGGGEPLMHKDVAKLVEFANKQELDVGFITSGQQPKWVTDDDIETIVRNTSWIRVSLDAGSPERYLTTHGLNTVAYNNALNFISKLVHVKEDNLLTSTIGVGYLTGIGDVEAEKEDYCNAAIAMGGIGVDYFQLRPLHGSHQAASFPKELKDHLESVGSPTNLLASDHKYKFIGEGNKGERTYDYCHGAHFASVVTANGGLYVCCHLRNQDVGKIADLHTTPLANVWGRNHDVGLRSAESVRSVTNRIDVDACVPYCRCDNFNRSLDEMVKGYKNTHKNFL